MPHAVLHLQDAAIGGVLVGAVSPRDGVIPQRYETLERALIHQEGRRLAERRVQIDVGMLGQDHVAGVAVAERER